MDGVPVSFRYGNSDHYTSPESLVAAMSRAAAPAFGAPPLTEQSLKQMRVTPSPERSQPQSRGASMDPVIATTQELNVEQDGIARAAVRQLIDDKVPAANKLAIADQAKKAGIDLEELTISRGGKEMGTALNYVAKAENQVAAAAAATAAAAASQTAAASAAPATTPPAPSQPRVVGDDTNAALATAHNVGKLMQKQDASSLDIGVSTIKSGLTQPSYTLAKDLLVKVPVPTANGTLADKDLVIPAGTYTPGDLMKKVASGLDAPAQVQSAIDKGFTAKVVAAPEAPATGAPAVTKPAAPTTTAKADEPKGAESMSKADAQKMQLAMEKLGQSTGAKNHAHLKDGVAKAEEMDGIVGPKTKIAMETLAKANGISKEELVARLTSGDEAKIASVKSPEQLKVAAAKEEFVRKERGNPEAPVVTAKEEFIKYEHTQRPVVIVSATPEPAAAPVVLTTATPPLVAPVTTVAAPAAPEANPFANALFGAFGATPPANQPAPATPAVPAPASMSQASSMGLSADVLQAARDAGRTQSGVTNDSYVPPPGQMVAAATLPNLVQPSGGRDFA